MTKALMIVGTSSFSGKTLIVAALCRIFRDAGIVVTPFKAQNMSLNSAVTEDGREISRAQAVQALAAGVKPTTEMNPILLKPKGDGTSQIVLNGKPFKDINARDYYESFVLESGAPAVKNAIDRLAKEFDILVMEGAGSPAEINLYDRDIANLAAADMADADVILVADIERGGVFASIYGTLSLLKSEHRKRVKGIIINKFRGDVRLLDGGIKKIEDMVKIPVIGVVPYIADLRLPEEDSQGLVSRKGNKADIAILRLPRLSNFTDFDPLAFDPRISLRYVSSPDQLGNPDAIIIPGTKSTLDDLSWLREKDFNSLKDFQGKIPIVGICGGFQILGKKIVDNGTERGEPSSHDGFGLLAVETIFDSYEKKTQQVKGSIVADHGIFDGLKDASISGYEIHMGNTKLLEGAQPVFTGKGVDVGAADSEYMTFGTYLHGLFDAPDFREGFINFVLKNANGVTGRSGVDISQTWEEGIAKAADTVKKCVDLSWFYEK
jgi:adenosylcobyric acid synthase